MVNNAELSPRSLGYHIATNREVLLLNLAALDARFTWGRPKDHLFACLCAIDSRGMSADELGTFCSHLLELGCAYFCAWGPDCERVHDVMDQQIVGDNPPQTCLGCVMTTWHANDSLDGALFYFLNCTVPDEDYAPHGCGSALVITVGSNLWSSAIEEHMREKTVPNPK